MGYALRSVLWLPLTIARLPGSCSSLLLPSMTGEYGTGIATQERTKTPSSKCGFHGNHVVSHRHRSRATLSPGPSALSTLSNHPYGDGDNRLLLRALALPTQATSLLKDSKVCGYIGMLRDPPLPFQSGQDETQEVGTSGACAPLCGRAGVSGAVVTPRRSYVGADAESDVSPPANS